MTPNLHRILHRKPLSLYGSSSLNSGMNPALEHGFSELLPITEKEKKFAKADLPVNLEEKKQESMEPQIQMLYQYISELPETDRIIISLELEEVKQAEIAHIVGLSESNIRVKIHRIKEKLTQKFKENGF